MVFDDTMGRTALASRLQNAASFAEGWKEEDTEECCKGSNIFAKCHPLNVKSGLFCLILNFFTKYDTKRVLFTNAE